MEKEGQGEFYITSYISTSIVYMYQITNHYIDFYRKQITDTTNLSILEVNTTLHNVTINDVNLHITHITK